MIDSTTPTPDLIAASKDAVLPEDYIPELCARLEQAQQEKTANAIAMRDRCIQIVQDQAKWEPLSIEGMLKVLVYEFEKIDIADIQHAGNCILAELARLREQVAAKDVEISKWKEVRTEYMNLANTRRDEVERLRAENERLKAVVPSPELLRILTMIRNEEGSSVTIFSDNADFNGPNCVIEVTRCLVDGWGMKEFRGDTLEACCKAAADRIEAANRKL